MSRDDGLAMLWLLGCIPVVFITVVTGSLVGTSMIHSRAESVADVTALAAAREIVLSPEPCDAAANIAAANSADLVECECDGPRVSVVIALSRTGAFSKWIGKKKIRARAAAEAYWEAESDSPAAPTNE